jgi:hypothetical protein
VSRLLAPICTAVMTGLCMYVHGQWVPTAHDFIPSIPSATLTICSSDTRHQISTKCSSYSVDSELPQGDCINRLPLTAIAVRNAITERG